MKIGDIVKFNPGGKIQAGVHFGIPKNEDVEVIALGSEYTYPGLAPKTCRRVSFKVISTGETFENFSSQWLGEVFEEVDF